MITQATIDTLDQGLSVLEELSDSAYNTKLPLVYGASVGGHYRHVLEHFITLYQSHTEGVVNYDLRSRNVEIETNRQAAITATKNLKEKWLALDSSIYDQAIEVQGKLSHKGNDSMNITTCVGREVAFAISHAQHHFAIIGVMCTLMQTPITEGFGVAPSTASHLKKQGEKPLSSK